MLEIENLKYRVKLASISYGQGRLSIFYKGASKAPDSRAEPDAFVDHSYSVLEGVLKGEFPSLSKGKKGTSREMIHERFFNSTGHGKIPQNLSYLLLNEFPVFFTRPEFNNGFVPMKMRNLGSFFEEREASLYSRMIKVNLSREEEFELFSSFNYHKKSMWENGAEILESNSKNKRFKHEVVGLLDAYKTSLFFTDVLVRANSRLIFTVLHKNARFQQELINLGLVALRNAVIGFDFIRGNKFSTYACRAILRELVRHKHKEKRFKYVDLEEHHQKDTSADDSRKDNYEYQAEIVRNTFEENAAELDKRQMTVLEHRFGLSGEPQTLDKVSKVLGVTKERIRQIQNKALKKLRNVLKERLNAGC